MIKTHEMQDGRERENQTVGNSETFFKFGVFDEARSSQMELRTFTDKNSMAEAAASHAAASIREAIQRYSRARILVATGTSQHEFHEFLMKAPGIDWGLVELFQLDDYIGLPISHPASFRKILSEGFIKRVGIKKYQLLDGGIEPEEAIRSLGNALMAAPIDVAFVGIGENGHLAFNDPPADFATEEPYLIVELDDACRRQQVGEGWFANLSDVPKKAISISVRQILKSREILVVVPDSRKAQAVKATLVGDITPMVPASILRRHQHTTMYLDCQSAALLEPKLHLRL
jgi:glucosamine-6-phosphate deaminase